MKFLTISFFFRMSTMPRRGARPWTKTRGKRLGPGRIPLNGHVCKCQGRDVLWQRNVIPRTWWFLFILEGKLYFFGASTASQYPHLEAWERIALKCRGYYTLAKLTICLHFACMFCLYVVGYEKRDLIVHFPNLHIKTFISLEPQQLWT